MHVVGEEAVVYPVSGVSDRRSLWPAVGTFVGAVGFSACLALLFSGMRAIMETGTGFVAVGGPYEIASPAPGWIWLIPVAILAGWVFGGLFGLSAWRWDRFRVVLAIWVMVFLVLGFNFLYFGITADGLVWGWAISGVAFVLMGVAPLLGPLWLVLRRRQIEARYGEYAFEQRVEELRLDARTRRFVMAGIAATLIVGFLIGLVAFDAIV